MGKKIFTQFYPQTMFILSYSHWQNDIPEGEAVCSGSSQSKMDKSFSKDLIMTVQSFYNTPRYNTGLDITQSYCGSQSFYHGVL